MSLAGAPAAAACAAGVADLERRFGGLRRLYGDAAYGRLRDLRVAVVGVGGVGSWAAEALARSGVAALTLVDLDHVSESNINRQVQALGATVGAAKVEALQTRIADIHPGCEVHAVDAFVEAAHWPLDALSAVAHDVVVDACDDPEAKLVLARWALQAGQRLVIAGAAGGKRRPQDLQVDDLVLATHDPLLAGLRQRLRKAGLLAPGGSRPPLSGLRCVYSRESVGRPLQAGADCAVEGSLNCAGYGSSVMVTASMGMLAAATAVDLALSAP